MYAASVIAKVAARKINQRLKIKPRLILYQYQRMIISLIRLRNLWTIKLTQIMNMIVQYFHTIKTKDR
jgi:hypothetical protein